MEKEPPSRDRWLTQEEENKLLAASPRWLQEIIIFAVAAVGGEKSFLSNVKIWICLKRP
jgi:hypothetical protein